MWILLLLAPAHVLHQATHISIADIVLSTAVLLPSATAAWIGMAAPIATGFRGGSHFSHGLPSLSPPRALAIVHVMPDRAMVTIHLKTYEQDATCSRIPLGYVCLGTAPLIFRHARYAWRLAPRMWFTLRGATSESQEAAVRIALSAHT